MALRLKSMAELKRLLSGKPPPVRTQNRSRRVQGVSRPQQILWEAVKARYPNAEAEKPGLVHGRRYIADIVIEAQKLVIEVDGWEYHGKYKSGFQRDREKDRALMLAGYRICRFSAGEILKDIATVVSTLDQIVAAIEESEDGRPGESDQ